MPSATLDVLDHGDLLSFAFADLARYHGRTSIGGVAIGFKVMERAFPLLSAAGPPDRHQVTVATAFPGPGARDAFELVTRAVTGDRYVVDLDLGPAVAPEAPEGRFFFRLGYRDRSVDLVLRPGLVPGEFVDLVRRGPATAAEEERLQAMKDDLAARLLAHPAVDVVDVVDVVDLVDPGDGPEGDGPEVR